MCNHLCNGPRVGPTVVVDAVVDRLALSLPLHVPFHVSDFFKTHSRLNLAGQESSLPKNKMIFGRIRSSWRNQIALFGKLSLADLQVLRIQAFFTGLGVSKLSCESNDKIRDVLASILWTAREKYRLMSHDPMEHIQPLRPESLWRRYGKPAVGKSRISKRVGWHTFRHSFKTLLKDKRRRYQSGPRTSSSRKYPRHDGCVCSGHDPAKRAAQSKLVRMVLIRRFVNC